MEATETSSPVFKRMLGESVYIGDCCVELIEIVGNAIRLRITAPRDLLACRGETYATRRHEPINSAAPTIPLAKYRIRRKTAA